MARKGNGRAAELVTRLVALGTATLVEQLGIPKQQAAESMREIAHNLARELGGTSVYVPQDHEFELTKRDMLIYERMGRESVATLAIEYKLSQQHIYCIARHVRDNIASKRQTPLPGFEPVEA